MKFTMSQDGALRATVHVRHRVDAGQVVEAVAIWLLQSGQDVELAAARLSRSAIGGILRERLRLDGDGANWPEYAEGEIDAARVAAAARVRELWEVT